VVERVLARGNDEGSLTVPDPRLSALGLLGMANYSYTWYDPAGRRTPEEIADRFADDFLRGVEVPS
jgi:tetracycline repressor-like protein